MLLGMKWNEHHPTLPQLFGIHITFVNLTKYIVHICILNAI